MDNQKAQAREQVGRIIDPIAFTDKYLGNRDLIEPGGLAARRSIRREKALATADAILAVVSAAPPPPASPTRDVTAAQREAMAREMTGYGPIISTTGVRPWWLLDGDIVARHLPCGLSERKAAFVTTWDHPFRVSKDHPFYGGFINYQNAAAPTQDALVERLREDAEAARLRWEQIAQAGGASVNRINVTREEACIASGVLDWIIPRLAALTPSEPQESGPETGRPTFAGSVLELDAVARTKSQETGNDGDPADV